MPSSFRFVDLFAGIGGFHAAMKHAGGELALAVEIDDDARKVYQQSWLTGRSDVDKVLQTDIRDVAPETGTVWDLGDLDVVTGGFPCQPFSKSGAQRGMQEARGTLFYNIAKLVEKNTPTVVMLENVRNLKGPKHGDAWWTIIETLRSKGYRVSSAPTVFSPHFLPPDRGGTPQVRERVFILGTYVGEERAHDEVPPVVPRGPVDGWDPARWDTRWILGDTHEAMKCAGLTGAEERALVIWEDFLQDWLALGKGPLPGHPLWTQYWVSRGDLGALGYDSMPAWKQRYVDKNVDFYMQHAGMVTKWRNEHRDFDGLIASWQKFEWQAGDLRSLWDGAIQFRPSGIRVKKPTYLPALVAINQTSIYGPERRRLTPRETARLQGFPDSLDFGGQRPALSYKQTGNGVAVGAVWHVFREHVLRDRDDIARRSPGLVEAVERADVNPLGRLLADEAYEA